MTKNISVKFLIHSKKGHMNNFKQLSTYKKQIQSNFLVLGDKMYKNFKYIIEPNLLHIVFILHHMIKTCVFRLFT